MSDTSPILSLPFILPAQAQKHVTHNEALARLDVLAQIALASFGLTAAPQVAEEGEVHVPGLDASGEWSGQAGRLAARIGGGWVFVAPREGWLSVEAATGTIRVFRAGAWAPPSLSEIQALGIGASADATNRLVVAGEASLLTHAGGDHRLKVNKADAGSTASLLFQSDWSGRAEMGIAGEDAFVVKVSPDGVAWTTALRVDPASGHLGGAAVQDGPADVTEGRLMRADYGYGPGNLLGAVGFDAGTPSGAVIESGSGGGGHYTRFADGTQICTGSFAESAVALSAARAGGFAALLAPLEYAVAFAAPPVVSVTVEEATDALADGATATATGLAPRVWAAAAGTVDVAGRYLAVGRWA